ncbi:hypothetical protein Hanom_Chr07g00636101 [Helianthus anomalus]
MDGVNAPDENGKISNLMDPDAEKQTFGQKSQNWPNLRVKIAFYSKMNFENKGFVVCTHPVMWHNSKD